MADPDFLATLGREFSTRMNPLAGSDWMSGADVCEILDEKLGAPLDPARLRALRPEDVGALATAFNAFLDSETVADEHVRAAVAATLWHWEQ
jgi:hypothetical protein